MGKKQVTRERKEASKKERLIKVGIFGTQEDVYQRERSVGERRQSGQEREGTGGRQGGGREGSGSTRI